MSATPANSQAAEEAKKNGKPYHICISTTPGDLNTPHGVYAKSFFDNAATFMECMYDWSKDLILRYLDKKSQNNFLYMEFSYKELGRSEQWFKNQCKALNMDLFKIKREILLQWNKTSDLSPFSEKQIIALYDNTKDPITRLMINEIHPVNIYSSTFDWRSSLIIGVDVASGMSRDSTAVVIWDPYSEEIVADFHDNTIDGFELQEFLVELVGTFFTKSIVVVERNNAGKQLMDFLLRTPIAKNLFYENKEVQAEKKVGDPSHQKASTKKVRVYGVSTDTKTRPMMMDILRDIVRFEYDKISSADIVAEIAGLERNKNDKIEHGEGGHDDLVMAMLIARYVWAYGKNLGNWMVSRSAIHHGHVANQDEAESSFMRQMSAINRMNNSHMEFNGSAQYGAANQLIDEWRVRQQYVNRSSEMGNPQADNNRARMARSIMNFNK